jgi:hypothetical protein
LGVESPSLFRVWVWRLPLYQRALAGAVWVTAMLTARRRRAASRNVHELRTYKVYRFLRRNGQVTRAGGAIKIGQVPRSVRIAAIEPSKSESGGD